MMLSTKICSKCKNNLPINEFSKCKEGKNGIHPCCKLCISIINRNSYNPQIDHDHETGMVRGALCARCNLLLGKAHDNIELLKSAISYLEKYSKSDLLEMSCTVGD